MRHESEDMDWSGSLRVPYVPLLESSLSFLYNCSTSYTPYPGMEVKQQALGETPPEAMGKMDSRKHLEKKKRLTSDQVDSLENSFQEEIKLDPKRKMKLSKELGLQPRQIAVWFQNRRVRWKTKQLENLYDSLKQEFDVMSKEKQKLREEVVKLKAMLRDQASRTNMSMGYTEFSGEDTVECTSKGLRCNNKPAGTIHHETNIVDGNCSFTVQDYNTVPVMPYWAGIPYYP